MANFFQRLINQALGTTFGVPEPTAPIPPPAEPPPPPAALPAPRALPKRVEFPISPQQGPRRLAPQAPTFAPGPRTHRLTLTGSVANDGYGGGRANRSATISFTDSQWKRYLYYQAISKTQTARVYALAEVYQVPQLAGATWDAEFDYDEFPMEDWPDYDEYNDYALA